MNPENEANSNSPSPGLQPGSDSHTGRGGHYLLTWTTYGTWLPGDVRGFVSDTPQPDGTCHRSNTPGTPYQKDDKSLHNLAQVRMRGGEIVLDEAKARVAVRAFEEVATTHRLGIILGTVMRTHVHLVVASGDREGAQLLQLFKGVASRRLGQAFGPPRARWWTTGGSRRLLTDARSVEGAVKYVRAHQSDLAVCGYACSGRPD